MEQSLTLTIGDVIEETFSTTAWCVHQWLDCDGRRMLYIEYEDAPNLMSVSLDMEYTGILEGVEDTLLRNRIRNEILGYGGDVQ